MESRHVRAEEAAIVNWMLTNASLVGPLHHLLAVVPTLNVFDRCRCGCGSVVFVPARTHRTLKPIADAFGRTLLGARIDVTVWGTSDAVTALEVIGPAAHTSALPSLESLQPSVMG
jgi:hypothetical protein